MTADEGTALRQALRRLPLEGPLATVRDALATGPGPARIGWWSEHPRVEAKLRRPEMVAVEAGNLPSLDLVIVGLSATQLLSQREKERIQQFASLCGGDLALVVAGLEELDQTDQAELTQRMERFAGRLGSVGWNRPEDRIVLLRTTDLANRIEMVERRSRSRTGWASSVAAFVQGLPEGSGQVEGKVLAELSLAQAEAEARLREGMAALRRELPGQLEAVPLERLPVEAPLILDRSVQQLAEGVNAELRKTLALQVEMPERLSPSVGGRRPMDPRVMLMAAGGLGALLLGSGLLMPVTGGASLLGAWALRRRQQVQHETAQRAELMEAVNTWMEGLSPALMEQLQLAFDGARERMRRQATMDPEQVERCRRLCATLTAEEA